MNHHSSGAVTPLSSKQVEKTPRSREVGRESGYGMPDVADNESELVTRAIAGDADAFGELYLNYLDPIYRYIFFRVDSGSDAEDLTEQVFLKAWEALPGYQQQGYPFSSWLYRIAHNAVADHYRRKKPTVPMPPPERIQLQSKQTGSLEKVIAEEETAALTEALRRLPEVQQQVILLRFVEGLAHAQIAEILDKSDGACRTLQYRALNTLNRLLKGDGREG